MTATASPPQIRPSYSSGETSRRAAGAPVVPSAPPSFSPLTFALRHWLYLILCLLISGVAAYHAAERFTVLKYNYEAQLLYNKIGGNSLGYEAPWLTALTPIVGSPSVLNGVREDLELDTDLKTLSDAIDVEVPYESSLFQISVQWPDQEQGKEILDRLIERFMNVIVMTRNASVEQTSGGLNASMYELDHKVQSIREQIQRFNARNDVLDLERDLITLRADIEVLEKSLGTAKHRNDGHKAQLEALTVPASGETTATGAQLAAAKKTGDLERWQVLRDLVSEEERRIQQEATLEFQEKEYERAKQMHEKQYISDAEFDAIESKLRILRSTNAPALAGLRDQLESVEKTVPAHMRLGQLSPAMLASDTSLESGVELALIADNFEIKYLEGELTKYRQRLDDLVEARIELQSLDTDLRSLVTEKARLQERQTDLANVRGAKPIEFSVVQPPSPAIDAVKSNKNKLLLGVFGGCMILLVGPLFLRDSMAARPSTGRVDV